MSDRLDALLLRDHQRLRRHGEELRRECEIEGASEGDCLRHFRTFKAMMVAHVKAEEYVAYALYENERGLRGPRRFVLEGYEEHDLIDLLLKEMGQAEELSDQFRAKLHVLLNLFEHHTREEEATFIPGLRTALSDAKLIDMAVLYARERDEIFNKKSGLKQPAPVINPRNVLTH